MIERGEGTVVVKGIGRVEDEKELSFNILNGDAASGIDNIDSAKNNIKNASISYEYDEDGTLIYKIDEKVGCLIDLSGDNYRITDYLPDDMGSTKIKLLNLESDEEEILINNSSDGMLEIDGFCEYPTNEIAKALYQIDSLNYGMFKVAFSISSVRPVTTNMKKVVNTNVCLSEHRIDLSEGISNKVIKETIGCVSTGGSYSAFAGFKDAKVILSDPTEDSGRIFWGSYAGRDEKYQSYKVNLYIDAININVSTKDAVTKKLSNGFCAKYVEGYIFSGSKIKPLVYITDENGNDLEYKKDYVLKYKNNKNAVISPLSRLSSIENNVKLPQITIKFKGRYKGNAAQKLNFYIIQKDISSFKVVYGNAKNLVKNAPISNEKVIRMIVDKENRRINKKDYIVSYVNQSEINADSEKQTNDSVMNKSEKKRSKFTLEIRGKNNYCGVLRTSFEI